MTKVNPPIPLALLRNLKIVSWNIRGLSKKLKELYSQFLEIIVGYDIVCIQEPHLWPTDPLKIPDGYSWIAPHRTGRAEDLSWGGVGVLYRSTLPVKVDKSLGVYEDFLAICIGDLTIWNVYIPPQDTRELSATDFLRRSLSDYTTRTNLDQDRGGRLLVVGDLNARCASLQSFPPHSSRKSCDQGKADRRGLDLVAAFASSHLTILNGFVGADATNGGCYTSFQPRGNTVIDYMAFKSDVISDIEDFWVGSRSGLSDHAPIFAIVKVRMDCAFSDETKMPEFEFNSQPQIASLPAGTNNYSCVTPQFRAYGLCSAEGGNPWVIFASGHVQADSSGQDGAGAGIYVGPNAEELNHGERVPGGQTLQRANLYAVLSTDLCTLFFPRRRLCSRFEIESASMLIVRGCYPVARYFEL
jgi:exonuclease III